jgi:hypothetical protein
LGPEPAFRELRRTELDYFEVSTPAQVLDVVKVLVESPTLFDAVVENAELRGKDFTEEKVFDQWFTLFNGPISREFETWSKSSFLQRITRFGIGVGIEIWSRRISAWRRSHGQRILN